MVGGNLTFYVIHPSDVWILQVSGTLGFAHGAQIVLLHGAKCQNIFWQVAGQIALGPSRDMGVVFKSGASLPCGRVLTQTAVTMIGNTITEPT